MLRQNRFLLGGSRGLDRGGSKFERCVVMRSEDLTRCLFLRGERERYDFVRPVAELRRRHGTVQEEEDAWKTLFEQDIDDCIFSCCIISDEAAIRVNICPACGAWQNSLMRQHITSRLASSTLLETRPAPAPTLGLSVKRETRLGISGIGSLDDADSDALALLAPISSPWPVSHSDESDFSQRVGDNGGSVRSTLSMYELFFASVRSIITHHGQGPRLLAQCDKHSGPGAGFRSWRDQLFRNPNSALNRPPLVEADPAGTAPWALHAPFCFSVESRDAETMPEKAWLYSRTVGREPI